jgi:hypothetical protein
MKGEILALHRTLARISSLSGPLSNGMVDRSDLEVKLARVRALLDRMAGRPDPGFHDAQEVRWRGLVKEESQLLDSLRSD